MYDPSPSGARSLVLPRSDPSELATAEEEPESDDEEAEA